MKRHGLVFAAVGVITALVKVCSASIVSMDYHFGGYSPASYTYTWEFDYELQQLTTTETILELQSGSWWIFHIAGRVDSESTFSVVRTITNNTGITWTGYRMKLAPPPVAGITARILCESIQTTKLKGISCPVKPDLILKLSGPPFVLDGESFTMSFDMHTGYDATRDGLFSATWFSNPIPEPATVLLLALGGLALRRRRS